MTNNQIRAAQVRLIDDAGKQLGIFPTGEALRMAQERNLDLIQVTEKVDPPVCKIMEYGKYVYWQTKKEKEKEKNRGGEVKGIRLTFGISAHDLETRANFAAKFLKQGNKVRVEMVLRGREKGFPEIAKDKIGRFIETLQKTTPVKIERELKREMRGFSMIIAKA